MNVQESSNASFRSNNLGFLWQSLLTSMSNWTEEVPHQILMWASLPRLDNGSSNELHDLHGDTMGAQTVSGYKPACPSALTLRTSER